MDIVDMVRGTPVSTTHDRFSCSVTSWDFLQELGQTFGWRPQGTTYIVPAKLRIEFPARHDYQPGDVLDYKRLDPEDALAWAHALETAQLSPQFSSMITMRWTRRAPSCEPQTQTLHRVVYEFTEYAYGGEFAFAISAAREPPTE